MGEDNTFGHMEFDVDWNETLQRLSCCRVHNGCGVRAVRLGRSSL